MPVELRKGQKVNLSKSVESNEFIINLNWTQTIKKKGLFGTTKSQAVDLDLGAFVELSNGKKHCIQALGNSFGSLTDVPYVMLDGDDRTGESTDGENLRVNGKMSSNIRRLLIYTFIYEGAANWQQVDGIVTIKCPGADDIVIKMDEYNSNNNMCAIAQITNIDGNFSVEKLVNFFSGHELMDKHFGWGFKWTVGRK
ncbi:MAG: TerD family protein [Defluviitaleaceae bacterium]|nr:TerD family protein [Defluviitaleaceae bacterium]